MPGTKRVNSDLNILGKLMVSTIPNLGTVTPVILTQNQTTKEISSRTGSEFISDLGLATQSWVTSQEYITNSALSGYLPLTGGTLSGQLTLSNSGLKFLDNPYGGAGDRASMYISSSGGEQLTLNIEVSNDSDDIINLITSSATGLKHNGNTVWGAGNFNPDTKVNKSGDTMTGNLNMGSSIITTDTSNSNAWQNAYNNGLVNRGMFFQSNVDANNLGNHQSAIISIELGNGTGNTNFPVNNGYGTFMKMSARAFTSEFFHQNGGELWHRNWYFEDNPNNYPFRKIWDSHNFNPSNYQPIGNYVAVDTVGGLNNASNSHINKIWFDYNWAGTGHAGSVINFSGLNGTNSTEIFGEYSNGGSRLGFRTKDGDTNTWNLHNWIWHSGNLPDYRNYGLGTINHVNTSDVNNISHTSIQGIDIVTANRPFNYGSVWTHRKGDVEFTQIAVDIVIGNLYTKGYNTINGSTGWKRAWNDTDFSWTDLGNWNQAYNWGNHALAGYATQAWITANFPNQNLTLLESETQEGQTIGISNGNSLKITNYFVTSRDSVDRNPNNIKPNTSSKRVRYDFINANYAGGTGNYSGLMTYAPFDGSTASTGDSSYQLAFINETGINGAGLPGLALRKGIDETWGSWYNIAHSGNLGLSYSGNTLSLIVKGTTVATATINAGNTYTAGSNLSLSGNTFNVVASPTFAGNVTAQAFYESSLRQFKTNIKPFELSGLDLVNSLDIVTFDRTDTELKDKIGIIADDTTEEFLSPEKNEVDLYKTIFIQAKAIQELIKRIEKLENKIK